MENDNVCYWDDPAQAAIRIRQSVLWGKRLSRDLNDIREAVRRMSAQSVGFRGSTPQRTPESKHINETAKRWLVYLWDSQYASVCHLGDMSGQVRK